MIAELHQRGITTDKERIETLTLENEIAPLWDFRKLGAYSNHPRHRFAFQTCRPYASESCHPFAFQSCHVAKGRNMREPVIDNSQDSNASRR